MYTKLVLRCFNGGPFSQIRSQMFCKSGPLLQIIYVCVYVCVCVIAIYMLQVSVKTD